MLHINWVLGPRWISWWQLRGWVRGLLWVQSYSFDYQHPSDCLIVYLLWIIFKSLYPKWVFTPSKSLSRHHIKQHMRFHGQHEHQLCEESWVALKKVIFAKIIFTLQRDSLLPLWFSNSNTFPNAGIRALTRPLQLEHASSPLPSVVLIFASFDLTSRKSAFFTFPRNFQMSHQHKRLKYFPLVRPWPGLPQRLQWGPAATLSPWQVLSFAPINTSSSFDQRIGAKWMDLFVEALKSYPSLDLCPTRSDWHRPPVYLWHQYWLSQWARIYQAIK